MFLFKFPTNIFPAWLENCISNHISGYSCLKAAAALQHGRKYPWHDTEGGRGMGKIYTVKVSADDYRSSKYGGNKRGQREGEGNSLPLFLSFFSHTNTPTHMLAFCVFQSLCLLHQPACQPFRAERSINCCCCCCFNTWRGRRGVGFKDKERKRVNVWPWSGRATPPAMQKNIFLTVGWVTFHLGNQGKLTEAPTQGSISLPFSLLPFLLLSSPRLLIFLHLLTNLDNWYK